MQQVRVLIASEDATGLVYRASKVFFSLGLNVEENQEFVDHACNRFFMRSVVSGEIAPDTLQAQLEQALPDTVQVQVVVPKKKKLVLLATKEPHCLGDILIRHCHGNLEAEVVAVIANHADLQALVQRFDVPFYLVSAEDKSRQEHEKAVHKVLASLDFEYLVLAKYMRILSAEFVAQYPQRIVNIHHSFLPSFVGANPYKQAWDRGVKIIGATAHFVTDDLDEGPIIAQDVMHVSHRHSWQQMRDAGRDIEKMVLARALRLVLADKVFVESNKTVIL